ncbi:MAG TPA: hypothetical protein VJY35_17100 [Candidatus Eisenbacteria bacterium]|nr:hypothetical protein [Candidatus Eisenbacteria bacterium]
MAAGVSVQSFGSMAEFQASPLYAYVTGAPGGAAQHKARGVNALRQGTLEVPAASAGSAGNSVITSEVATAVGDVPDCLSLSGASSFYNKKFLSIGNEASGNSPNLTLEIEAASSGSAGGFNGYDILILDLGKNLANGTGNGNTEATVFEVELVSQGQRFSVGSITNSGGNYVNAILLDITGIPGIPAALDAVRLTDTVGNGNPAGGALDVDGVITLNPASLTPTRGTTWGRLKSTYR